MIAALALAALEWSAAALAVAAGAYAAAGSLWVTAISGAAAIVAGLLRSLAFGRAADARADAMLRRLSGGGR